MEAETLASQIEQFEQVTDVDMMASGDIMFIDMKYCNRQISDLLGESRDWLMTVPSEDAEPLVDDAKLRMVVKL